MDDFKEAHGHVMDSVREMYGVLNNEILNSDLADEPSDEDDWKAKESDIRHKLEWVRDEIANLKDKYL